MEFNGYIVQGPAAAAQTAFAISTVPVMSFVYPFASLGINIVIFFALLHLRWKRKSKKAMGTIEWNLFLICLFTLIIQFLLMLFLRYAYKIFDLSTVAFGLNLVSDFSTLSETFIGLALNTTMRGEMIRMLIKSTSFRKIFQGSSTRQETSSLKVTACIWYDHLCPSCISDGYCNAYLDDTDEQPASSPQPCKCRNRTNDYEVDNQALMHILDDQH
ncbi:unnamed protein product, partial [Mesorhabditis belari]|uniref:Uncharacterized protein n=1 Tax=Mesorhabditis belari TaxID=2138241 RepID=A0AAF3ET45_9BILA